MLHGSIYFAAGGPGSLCLSWKYSSTKLQPLTLLMFALSLSVLASPFLFFHGSPISHLHLMTLLRHLIYSIW